MRDFHETGFGVSKRAWHDSPAVQLLAQNTAKPVYSNSPQSVYLWTRQAGYPLGSFKSRTKRGVVEPSLVILFNYIAEDDLLAKLDLDLQLLEQDNIAAIYFITCYQLPHFCGAFQVEMSEKQPESRYLFDGCLRA